MKPNRKPPAYLEFAASMMANATYRSTSPAERGLLYAMRLECWENDGAPNNPEKLARIFGFTREEVSACLPAIMPLFMLVDGRIICKELDDYKKYLAWIRLQKSEGGKSTALKAKLKSSSIADSLAGSIASTKSQLLNPIHSNPNQSNPVYRKANLPVDDSWVNDYAAASKGD